MALNPILLRQKRAKRMLPEARTLMHLLVVLCALGASAAHSVAYAQLPIQSWKSATGAKVLFVENRSLPMLDISVEFPAGSGFDTAQRSGRAALTQQMRGLGAGGLREDEIAQRIADVGARLSGRFDTDRAGSHLRTLSSAREREQALDIFARVLAQPEFPQAAIEREKARMTASLRDADTKPDTLANRAFNRLVYRDHPYGLRSAGEIDTIAKLTRADLVEFFQTHYVAERAIVAIMGDVSRTEAQQIAERLTQYLPRARGHSFDLPEVTQLAQANTNVIAHPASQAHILVGAPGIGRGHPDYFSLFVGNYVLGGGGFSSRLIEEVRQKRGLAYSVYSYFAPLKHGGIFQIGLQTQGDQAQTALKIVRETLAKFTEHGPSEAELAEAKSNIIGGFPLRIDSNRKIHEYLALIGFYDLPLTYLDDFVKQVERVSVADVRAAFSRHVHTDRLVTVMVGGGQEAAARH